MKYDNKKVRYFVKDVEIKPTIDFTSDNGNKEFIDKTYNENSKKLSTLEKEVIKQLKKRNI